MNHGLGAMAATAVLALGHAAWADDLGFRYDEADGRCELEGAEGHNPDFVGECGDLSGLYLFGRDLRGANLKGAILFRTNLTHADLRGADLRGASLAGSYLYQANLCGADLRGASFETRLKGAELYRVELDGARFDESTRLPFSMSAALERRMVSESEISTAR